MEELEKVAELEEKMNSVREDLASRREEIVEQQEIVNQSSGRHFDREGIEREFNRINSNFQSLAEDTKIVNEYKDAHSLLQSQEEQRDNVNREINEITNSLENESDESVRRQLEERLAGLEASLEEIQTSIRNTTTKIHELQHAMDSLYKKYDVKDREPEEAEANGEIQEGQDEEEWEYDDEEPTIDDVDISKLHIDWRLGHSPVSEEELKQIRESGGVSEAEMAALTEALENYEPGAQDLGDGVMNGADLKALLKELGIRHRHRREPVEEAIEPVEEDLEPIEEAIEPDEIEDPDPTLGQNPIKGELPPYKDPNRIPEPDGGKIVKIDPRDPIPDPRDPIPDPRDPIPDPKDPIPDPRDPKQKPNPELLPVDSGLQQYRNQMNFIRDNYPILDRHTLTERLPLPQALTTVAGAAIGAFGVGTFPFGLVPVAAAAGISAAARPLLYRLTGQKDLEEKISAQLAAMDDDKFDMMVDFLTEGEIQDLKPNAVFLRSLNRVMGEKAREKQQALTTEQRELTTEQEDLLERKDSLTPDEIERLNAVSSRLDEIRDEATVYERRVLDIRRGKDRVSQRFKGNLLTRFNIFAHRNSTSEEYDGPINALADGEKTALEGERDRDYAERAGDTAAREEAIKAIAEGQKEMRRVMESHTFTNAFGVQTSEFNARDHAIRIISDVKDNTARNVARIGLAGIGMAKAIMDAVGLKHDYEDMVAQYENVRQQANRRGTTIQGMRQEVHTANQKFQSSITQQQMEGAMRAEGNRVITGSETANLHEHGVTTTSEYAVDDAAAQVELRDFLSSHQATSGTAAEKLEQLSQTMRDASGTDAIRHLQDMGNQGLGFNPAGGDHATQLDIQSTSVGDIQSEADIVQNASVVARFLESLDTRLQNLSPDLYRPILDKLGGLRDTLLGPAIMAAGASIETIHDAIKNRQERRQVQETDNER